MINRILIRIKVLQIVYSYYQNGSGDLKLADKELMFSLQKSYDLYYYLLLLIVEVTNLHRRTLDIRKHKFMPTEEDLNPNTRLIDNRFVAQLEQNEMLQKYVSEQGISWANDEEFVKDVLDSILASDIYADYLKNPEDNYDVDREFWRSTFKNLICCSDDVEEYLGASNLCCHRLFMTEPSVIAQGMHVDNIALTYELQDVTLNYKVIRNVNHLRRHCYCN